MPELALEVDVEFETLDVGLLPAGRVEMEAADGQPPQFALERAELHAEIEQGADEHVAAQTGENVEVKGLHGHPAAAAEAARALMLAAAYPPPNPLSMFTTVRPLAHELSIPSNAVSPPK